LAESIVGDATTKHTQTTQLFKKVSQKTTAVLHLPTADNEIIIQMLKTPIKVEIPTTMISFNFKSVKPMCKINVLCKKKKI
jgi:hypothetical protein